MRTLATAVVAGGVLLFTLVPAHAHEHMYIGSTVDNKGALVVRYDFNRPFPLAPLPGTDKYIGTDPAFNAQLQDDPANGIFALRKGTKVSMQITGIEPPVSVVFNGKTMKAVGDKGLIGTMPYLHQHPEWYVTVPPGVYGDYHLSFRVIASNYAPSPAYTATLRVEPTATTTTTTVPGGGGTTTTLPCTPATCDDDNRCTIDACVPECQHVEVVGIDAVSCRLDGAAAVLDGIRPTTKASRRFFAGLYRTLTKVKADMQTAEAGGKRASAMSRRAEKRLSGIVTALDRGVQKNLIDSDGADAVRTLASDAYDKLVLLHTAQP